ncbi:MAG TPA: PAS domain-containing protein [Candidatus Aquilonibacter sp.]
MDDQAIIDKIQSMGVSELDELPVGVITLDRAGKILRYNKKEAELARLDQSGQLGKDFFDVLVTRLGG